MHIPVIHKGYLDFFNETRGVISHIYIISEELLAELSQFKSSISSIDSTTAQEILVYLGFRNTSVLKQKDIAKLVKQPILLIQDEVSRALHNAYFHESDIQWRSVFLRWDREKVLSEHSIDNTLTSSHPFDRQKIAEAYEEAKKSGDWWRQVGAVLVCNNEVILRAYNQGVPDDNILYQAGSVRDFLKPGEKPELSNTIHAEQKLIANAAQKGFLLDGCSLYVTHFPCAVCAKLIVYSGIKKCYFAEGSSNLDGKDNLVSAGVSLIKVLH